MAYSKIAASPDGSSSYFLPRLIGLRRALELTTRNRVLSAREALEWGLVTRVLPDAEFTGAVDALARELAQGPTMAFGAAKRLFHQSTQESLETQMELEAQAIAACGHTEDFRVGVTAFARKQAAAFRGADDDRAATAALLSPGLILLRQDEGAPLVLGGRVRSRRRPGRSERPGRRCSSRRAAVPAVAVGNRAAHGWNPPAYAALLGVAYTPPASSHRPSSRPASRPHPGDHREPVAADPRRAHRLGPRSAIAPCAIWAFTSSA